MISHFYVIVIPDSTSPQRKIILIDENDIQFYRDEMIRYKLEIGCFFTATWRIHEHINMK